MSDTPRTDAASSEAHGMPQGSGPWRYVEANFARQLERELTAAQASLAHNKELHDRLLGEYASVDTEIRNAAVAVGITQEFVDGDSYNVPGPEELIECIMQKFTAAQAEIARLKAGGCARNQRTTQFCAEALALQEENTKLKERVKRLEGALDVLAAIIGPPGSDTWATDDQLNQAWKLYMKAKDTQ